MINNNIANKIFTFQKYKEFLLATKCKYSIKDFEVFESPNFQMKKFAILRHDVDISPSYALKIAENQLSQYFYQVNFIIVLKKKW